MNSKKKKKRMLKQPESFNSAFQGKDYNSVPALVSRFRGSPLLDSIGSCRNDSLMEVQKNAPDSKG